MQRLRSTLLVVLGFIMVLSPLALWVAWTEEMFYAILIIFCLSFCLLCVVDNTMEPNDNC